MAYFVLALSHSFRRFRCGRPLGRCSGRKGRRYWRSDTAGVKEGSASIEGFATDIAEGKLYCAAVVIAVVCGQRNGGDTGQLADLFAVGLQRRAGRGEISVEAKCAECAVDIAARTDALDDLLAEVAAFEEVQGAGLSGLLGELAVADVGGVEWRSFKDSQPFQGLGFAEC